MREPLKFAVAVLKNWGSIVTSGVLIGAIGIWQATGHYVAHWIYWFVASLGLLRAFYRTWLGERQTVLALMTELTDEKANRSEEVRSAQLTITRGNGSRYILQPVENIRRGDFRAIYLEFYLMIENSGRRNSVVNSFRVEIVELGRTFPNLVPVEGRRAFQGRHCLHGLNTNSILSTTGVIRVGAENTTNRGTLAFLIPEVTLEMFAASGLHMTGGQRTFPPLHCRLTLIDTTQASATAEFELHEE